MPDALLAFYSALRALYFLFVDIKDRFRYLKPAISILLMYVGAKMLIAHWYHVSTVLSLGFILTGHDSGGSGFCNSRPQALFSSGWQSLTKT